MVPAAALLMMAATQIPAAPALAPPAQVGITRTDLERNDLSIAGWENIQTRVDFLPGAAVARHRHPGEEIVYVLAGTLQYRVEGKPTAVMKAGDVLFIPKGVAHSAVNIGLDVASELATYVVEKGRPLVEPVK